MYVIYIYTICMYNIYRYVVCIRCSCWLKFLGIIQWLDDPTRFHFAKPWVHDAPDLNLAGRSRAQCQADLGSTGVSTFSGAKVWPWLPQGDGDGVELHGVSLKWDLKFGGESNKCTILWSFFRGLLENNSAWSLGWFFMMTRVFQIRILTMIRGGWNHGLWNLEGDGFRDLLYIHHNVRRTVDIKIEGVDISCVKYFPNH